MRTTRTPDEDAALAARKRAQRERISLGEASSELVRRGAAADGVPLVVRGAAVALRDRFALLPARDEVITRQHVRELMDRRQGL